MAVIGARNVPIFCQNTYSNVFNADYKLATGADGIGSRYNKCPQARDHGSIFTCHQANRTQSEEGNIIMNGALTSVPHILNWCL
jgi:hypothetical protein